MNFEKGGGGGFSTAPSGRNFKLKKNKKIGQIYGGGSRCMTPMVRACHISDKSKKRKLSSTVRKVCKVI